MFLEMADHLAEVGSAAQLCRFNIDELFRDDQSIRLRVSR